MWVLALMDSLIRHRIFHTHTQTHNTHRFFFGKNKVMQKALGKSDEDEYKDGLHHVAEVTNAPLVQRAASPTEHVMFFRSCSKGTLVFSSPTKANRRLWIGSVLFQLKILPGLAL